MKLFNVQEEVGVCDIVCGYNRYKNVAIFANHLIFQNADFLASVGSEDYLMALFGVDVPCSASPHTQIDLQKRW